VGDSNLDTDRSGETCGTAAAHGMRVLMNQLPPLPFVVAGVLLMMDDPIGIYWVVPGVLLAIAAAILGA
jgi:hypothetical protein